jgi:hypothetical protein
MRILDLGRRWLGICVAAASVTACAGSQPPIGTLGAMTKDNGNTSSSFQVLYRFGRRADRGGAAPNGPLFNVNGTLYGTTRLSHTCRRRGCGNKTVFSITTTGQQKVLYNFKGGSDGAIPTGPLNGVAQL